MSRFRRWLHTQFLSHHRVQRRLSHTATVKEIRQIRRRADEIRRTLARVEAQVEAVTRDRPD